MPELKFESAKTLDMLNPFTAAMPETIKQFSGMYGRMMSACMRYNLEYLEFLKRRVEKDIALVEDLAGRKDPSDLISSCADFWQTAYTDYSDEVSKLAAMGSDLVSETSGEARKQAEVMKDRVKVQAAA